jgi:hypothetical protein
LRARDDRHDKEDRTKTIVLGYGDSLAPRRA